MLAAIRDTDGRAELAVVGHDPSISHLAVLLDDGEGTPTARAQLQAGFPPGGVAVFTLGTPLSTSPPVPADWRTPPSRGGLTAVSRSAGRR